jgi:hypothetical protein
MHEDAHAVCCLTCPPDMAAGLKRLWALPKAGMHFVQHGLWGRGGLRSRGARSSGIDRKRGKRAGCSRSEMERMEG